MVALLADDRKFATINNNQEDEQFLNEDDYLPRSRNGLIRTANVTSALKEEVTLIPLA